MRSCKVLVSATKVAQDLVSPDAEPAACTAEEIIRRCIAEDAIDLCDEVGIGPPWLHPDESLLEDVDFEVLYDDDMDGAEDDPAYQAAIGLEVAGVDDWFTPFNPHRLVHPYAETEPSERNALHNLRRRLRGLGEDTFERLRSPRVDASTPITSLAPHSDAVAMARRAVEPRPGMWVADEANPDDSFHALVEATQTSASGSGWLTWEPYEDADLIREDEVIMFQPHRHFPVGPDEPYADASLGNKIISIPLSVVVSYRPDPDVRERWNDAFSGPRA